MALRDIDGHTSDEVYPLLPFDDHLELCLGCDHYLVQLQQTIDLMGELPEESLSTPCRQRLLDAFADWHQRTGTTPP
ncbi:MAG: hypothetical protein ACXWDL_10255 [Nocardioides sp.]